MDFFDEIVDWGSCLFQTDMNSLLCRHVFRTIIERICMRESLNDEGLDALVDISDNE